MRRLISDPRGNRWDENNRRVRTPIELTALPEEVVGLIAQHMIYPMLLKWMATCKTMNHHCWNTWRGQALLLTKSHFGTEENYKAVFDKWVTRRMWNPSVPGSDWLDAGVHIVHRYLEARPGQNPLDEWVDRTDRARTVMDYARHVYATEYNDRLDDPRSTRDWTHEQLMKKLSAVHMDLQVLFLLPKTGLTFKKALERRILMCCIRYKEKVVTHGPTNFFLSGPPHPDDEELDEPEVQQVAGPDPQVIVAQAQALFAPLP